MATTNPAVTASLRVLIVDDDPLSRTFLEQWLSTNGLHCRCCASLSEADQVLTAARFDVLLVDERLPDGRGSAWLRSSATMADATRAIVLSGDQIDPSALPERTQFLRKPVDPDQLLCLLRTDDPARPTATTPEEASNTTLPDLDDASALRALGNRMQSVLMLRQMLLTELQRDQPVYQQLIAGNASPAASEVLHRLRAACALTGCLRLAAAAAALEVALQAGSQPTLEQLTAFADALAAVLVRLRVGAGG